MKTIFQYCISALVVLTIFYFSSCSPNKNNVPPKIENYYLIVKFEKQEYAKYVTATKQDRKAKAYTVYGVPLIESERGKEPYVYLGDGYYLSKWSWWAETLPIRYNNPYPHYLLDTLWTDLSSNVKGSAVYLNIDKTPLITTNPATEIFVFKYYQLDKYFGLNYEEMMPEKFHRYVKGVNLTNFMEPAIWFGNISFDDKEEYIAVCDSINQIYMNKIKEAFDTNREALLRSGNEETGYFYWY